MCKKEQVHLRMLSTKCVYKSYIYLIYMYKVDLALNNLQWLICHKTQSNQIITFIRSISVQINIQDLEQCYLVVVGGGGGGGG